MSKSLRHTISRSLFWSASLRVHDFVRSVSQTCLTVIPFCMKISKSLKQNARKMFPTHSCDQPLTTSSAGELLALLLVNLWFQMESLSVTHPAFIVLDRPHNHIVWHNKVSWKSLLGRTSTKTTQDQKKVRMTVNLDFQELLDSYYSNTHTHTHKDRRERDGFSGGTKTGNGDCG